MPYKDPEKKKQKNKEYCRKWYSLNKDKHKATTNAIRRKKRKEWRDFKKTLKCHTCGFSHPAVIDFHHVVKEDKKDINKLIKNGHFKQAYEELEKCIPLCANCHRIFHYQEREDKKRRKKKNKGPVADSEK